MGLALLRSKHTLSCSHHSGFVNDQFLPSLVGTGQVTRMHFFPQKVDDLFLVVALKTPTPFRRPNKTNKTARCGNIFYFLLTLLPKQSNLQG